jgi:hypothetical protein
VEFKYPELVQLQSSAIESVEGVRNRLNLASANPASNGSISVVPTNSPEFILTELQNLRKKYDAVVEYTVHLTAERDAIVSQLETSQRELVKEKSKKKTNHTSSDVDNNLSRSNDRKSSEKVLPFNF